MVGRNSKDEPFRWIKQSRYLRSKMLNFLEWHAQLSLRQAIAPHLSERFGIKIHPVESQLRIKMLEVWQLLKTDPVPADISKLGVDHFGDHPLNYSSRLRAVRSLTVSDLLRTEASLENSLGVLAIDQARSAVREPLSRALSPNSRWASWMNNPVGRNSGSLSLAGSAYVDLAVRDDLLIEDFKVWLSEARETMCLEMEAASREAQPHFSEYASLRKKKLDTPEWARLGLLPCMDVLLQCAQSHLKVTTPLVRRVLARDKQSDDAIRKTLIPLANSFLQMDKACMSRMRELEVMAMNLIYR